MLTCINILNERYPPWKHGTGQTRPARRVVHAPPSGSRTRMHPKDCIDGQGISSIVVDLDRYSHMIDAMYWDAFERVPAFSQRKTQKKDSRI
jgi:hypothetical protein